MKDCSCDKCIGACLSDPGRLVPGDIPKLSEFLNLSERELGEDYLVRVPVTSNGHVTHALAPAKKKGRRFIAAPGTTAPDYYAEEKGRCIFLDEKGRCSVHAAKPFECGAYMGCRDTFLGKPYRAKVVEEFFYKRWKCDGTGTADQGPA
jgi:Fe-S-cluster containining protein